MNIDNVLKRTDINTRGIYVMIHMDTGRIWAKTSENIRKDLIKTYDELKAGTFLNDKMQRYYKANPKFDIYIQISTDGMKGAKKDLANFKAKRSSYLFI